MIYFWSWTLTDGHTFYYPTSFWPDYQSFIDWYTPVHEPYLYALPNGLDGFYYGGFYNQILRFPFSKIPAADWPDFIANN